MDGEKWRNNLWHKRQCDTTEGLGHNNNERKTVYLHVLNNPENPAFIFIPELKDKIAKASLLNGQKEIKFKQQPEGTFIYIDGVSLDNIDTIIQIELK